MVVVWFSLGLMLIEPIKFFWEMGYDWWFMVVLLGVHNDRCKFMVIGWVRLELESRCGVWLNFTMGMHEYYIFFS